MIIIHLQQANDKFIKKSNEKRVTWNMYIEQFIYLEISVTKLQINKNIITLIQQNC